MRLKRWLHRWLTRLRGGSTTTARRSPRQRQVNSQAWTLRRRTLAIAFLGIAAFGTWLVWPEDVAPQLSPVTVPVARGDIENVIATSGNLRASKVLDVGAQVSGQLKKLHVRLGDTVSAGDLLAEIDDYIQQARVAAAEASLRALEVGSPSLQANFKLAQAELARQERLMKAQATTKVEHERAIANLAQTQADLARYLLQIEQVQATVREARVLLAFTRITAPSRGTVVGVHVQEGQTLNAVQTTPVILRIGNLDMMQVIAKIPEPDILQLTPGMEAYFTTLAGGHRLWWTSLQEISPLPQMLGGLNGMTHFDAMLRVDNADRALWPGISAKVFFLTSVSRNVLKVPLGALAFTDGLGPTSAAAHYALHNDPEISPRVHSAQTEVSIPNLSVSKEDNGAIVGPISRFATVQVIGRQGKVERRSVRVGLSNSVEAEILSGLSEGERVVIGLAQSPMSAQVHGFGNFILP